MRKNIAKNVLAIAMAGTMVLSNGMAVLASTATGNGIVEYDNSEAIAYDIVQVPTLTPSTYNFTLDPTGQLHTYLPGAYDEGTVYFQSAKSAATLEGATVNNATVTLYTQSKEVVDDVSGSWGDIISAKVEGDGKALDEVAEGFFVWVPNTTDTTYTTGLPGKFEELTASNIENWFDLDLDTETVSLKDDYKAAPNVCDGNVYQLTYTALVGNKITDSAADPLSNYVTLTNGAVTAVANIYKAGSTSGTYVAAEVADVKYTAAVAGYQGVTDAVTVINKSTDAKVVTATVTMSNIDGISFSEASTFEADDATTKIYVAATNGTDTNALALSSDGTTATATYTVELAAPSITENTFMTEDTNSATGGHDYARYEGYGTTYGEDSFYITATANSNEDAAEAWNEWLASVTAETRPQIDIVYTVESKTTDSRAVFGTNNEIAGTIGTSVAFSITDGTGDLAIDQITDVVVTLNNGTEKSLLTNGVVQTNNSGAIYIALTDSAITISKNASSYMNYDSDIVITYTSVGGTPVTVTCTFVEAN